MTDDDQAQAALDWMTEIARCPECGTSSETPWRMLDDQEVGLCNTRAEICRVVYFRRDGARLYTGTPQNFDGTWAWSHAPGR